MENKPIVTKIGFIVKTGAQFGQSAVGQSDISRSWLIKALVYYNRQLKIPGLLLYYVPLFSNTAYAQIIQVIM